MHYFARNSAPVGFPNHRENWTFRLRTRRGARDYACRAICVSSPGSNLPVLELDPAKDIQISNSPHTQQHPSYRILANYEYLGARWSNTNRSITAGAYPTGQKNKDLRKKGTNYTREHKAESRKEQCTTPTRQQS